MAQRMSNQLLPSGITPLLIQGAVERTGSSHIPGQYCSDSHLWMVDGRPIIDGNSSLPELITKTEQQLESDDNLSSSCLEMQTKTLSQVESDDENYRLGLLELSTKTDAVIERDD